MISDGNEFISLLYPDRESAKRAGFENGIIRSLGMGDFFRTSSPLENYLSCDAETVAYRQETVKDLTECPEIFDTFVKCIPILKDIAELRSLSDSDAESYLNGITEAELYITLLETLSGGILPYRDRLCGRGMKKLCDRVELLTESEHYKKINSALNVLTSRVRDIKSVCLAVNLDGTLKPESAGLVSVNDKKYTFSGAVERILKVDFSKDDNRCIAPLTPFGKNFGEAESSAMRIALNNALSTVFKGDFRAWKNIVKTYVLENTDFLTELLPECEILQKAVEFIRKLEERGIKTSYPEIKGESENAFAVSELVNPVTALKVGGEIVGNDITFDENAGIYVVTGPNRGGKSVLTCAVGCAFVMAHLGMPICAEKAEMSLCDGIFCHFPDGAEDTTGKGRLGEECDRLSEILAGVTEKSVVLLDETLSSTGSVEASCIAAEVVSALSVIGCRCIFSTHLHTLASQISEINERCVPLGGRKVDSLVAEVENGKRSFKLRRAAPVGKSFASDIADKYGLSFTEIMKKREPKQ